MLSVRFLKFLLTQIRICIFEEDIVQEPIGCLNVLFYPFNLRFPNSGTPPFVLKYSDMGFPSASVYKLLCLENRICSKNSQLRQGKRKIVHPAADKIC